MSFLSGFCRSLLLREGFKPGQRSLVMSSLSGFCRSLLLREDFKPGQRSLVMSSLSGLCRSLLLREDFKLVKIFPRVDHGSTSLKLSLE